MKLHLGCGKIRFDGYVNIDRRLTIATDLIGDVCALPFANGSLQQIESYHLVEHIARPAVASVLAHWFDLLAPNGQLVMELPDFDAAVVRYLGGADEALNSIFGLQRFVGDAHFFGYNEARISRLCTEAGFSDVRIESATDYHTTIETCLRVVATKR